MARPRSAPTPTAVSARDARRVVLSLSGLAVAPPRADAGAVARLVGRLGDVQIDSINIVERAHHHILASRLDGYRPSQLATNLERSRRLFEHWTHDASAIPSAWYPYWTRRFEKHALTPSRVAWWRERFATDPRTTIERVLERVRADGPLRARDVVSAPRGASQGWWDWSPEKTALEHLWRRGDLLIARRDGFEKVYDVAERVLPQTGAARPSAAEIVEWACREALARVGIATPKELAGFFGLVEPAEARTWCASAIGTGEALPVSIERADGGAPVAGVALPDWRKHAVEPATEHIIPLSPFDPIVRDRARLARLFAFDYRFEAFVPAPKRRHGYYVLPLLEGDRLVGRIDPKLDREAGTLVARGPWWEPAPAREIARRRKRLAATLDALAARLGATSWTLVDPPPTR